MIRVRRKMISIIDDGVYCPKCRKFHPTLMWHEKYGYKNTVDGKREELRKLVDRVPALVGLTGDASEKDKRKAIEQLIKANMDYPAIDEDKNDRCVVCGTETCFTSRITGRHVCSDECLYRENNWGEDCTGRTFDFLDPSDKAEYNKLCRDRNWPE